MFQLITETIEDWQAGQDAIRAAPYGVIETTAGRLAAVHLRRFPKLIAWPEFWPVGPNYHARGDADRCWLYYNQPRRFPNFLALKYVVSTRNTSFATFRAAVTTLDRLAELKQIDALLCDAANSRLSDRSLRWQGWQPHKPQWRHRNYIKRFYGDYPARRHEQVTQSPEVPTLEASACENQSDNLDSPTASTPALGKQAACAGIAEVS